MTKITTGPYVYLSNADLSASFNGPAFESRDYYGLGMMITALPATAISGKFTVDHSNDGINWFASNIFANPNPVAVAVQTTYGVTGAPGFATEVAMIPWVYTRWNWLRTSGTGTATFIVAGNRV